VLRWLLFEAAKTSARGCAPGVSSNPHPTRRRVRDLEWPNVLSLPTDTTTASLTSSGFHKWSFHSPAHVSQQLSAVHPNRREIARWTR
jgi:hypothetical protein